MNERLQWLCLGLALANTRVLSRVLSELHAGDFSYGHARGLFRALGEGREAVRTWLIGQGVTLTDEQQQAADAILSYVREHGRYARQQALADELRDAAKLMSPEEWQRFAAMKLAQANGTPAIAGKIEASA